MELIKTEITKEEYENIKSSSNIDKAIESILPIDIVCGYGFYGGKVFQSNNKYFMEYSIGSSCD